MRELQLKPKTTPVDSKITMQYDLQRFGSAQALITAITIVELCKMS